MAAQPNLDNLTLEQLFDCGRFGQSAVAEDRSGNLVSIYDVARGLACECICPSCRRPMVARTKDDIRVAHFAHYGTSDSTCTSAGETALHMFAKQVLNERLEIALPELVEEVDFEREPVVSARRVRFDEAILETRIGHVIPDVILIARGRRLIVEFRVTHQCGPEKIALIQGLNIGAIEIDLSDLYGTRLRDLAPAILFRAGRKWLHNPHSKAARVRAGARAQLRRSAVAAEVSALVGNYEHVPPADEPGNGSSETVARQNGLADLINLDVRGSGCFGVALAEWQAVALLMVLNSRSAIEPGDIVQRLRDFGWVAEWAIGLPADVEAGLRERVPGFLTPEEAVATYLDEMTIRQALVRLPDGCYHARKRIIWMVRNAQEERFRPARRYDEAKAIVDGILRSLPFDEVKNFDFEKWALAPIGHGGLTLSELVRSDERSWRRFHSALRTLPFEIRSRPEGTHDLMGLPLDLERGRALDRKSGDQREPRTSPPGSSDPSAERQRGGPV